MSESIEIVAKRTEALDAATRAAIIDVCIKAHNLADFQRLFTYIPSGGLHFLAYRTSSNRAQAVVSHAVVTTRWLQPEGHPLLKTAYIDAVATLPAYQRQGIGSALLRTLALGIADYEIGCLETDRLTFYAQVGWEVWRGPLAGRRGTELLPTPEQKGIMILRLAQTPPLDLDSSLTIEYDGRIW
ncbi:MAG: GNAT family N-acetyltransferase [Caldilinea sp. CFX5]|nr:GNAT family N-acetyltransferase [Caldilinea sp. CFX5]